MVSKVSKQGAPYEINGRQFIWQPEDDFGSRDTMDVVVIPLRLKMKTVLKFSDADTLDSASMSEMLKSLLPEAHKLTIDEMDVNDFTDMFSTWQDEYNALTGGSLGESSAAPSSSETTEPPSSTTSEVVSISP